MGVGRPRQTKNTAPQVPLLELLEQRAGQLQEVGPLLFQPSERLREALLLPRSEIIIQGKKRNSLGLRLGAKTGAKAVLHRAAEAAPATKWLSQ